MLGHVKPGSGWLIQVSSFYVKLCLVCFWPILGILRPVVVF